MRHCVFVVEWNVDALPCRSFFCRQVCDVLTHSKRCAIDVRLQLQYILQSTSLFAVPIKGKAVKMDSICHFEMHHPFCFKFHLQLHNSFFKRPAAERLIGSHRLNARRKIAVNEYVWCGKVCSKLAQYFL